MTINTRKVFKIYKTLDREQIQIILDKKIEGSHTIDEWLKRLYKLAVMDSIGDDTRQRSGNLSITFGIFLIFTVILTISKPFMFFFPLGFLMLFGYFIFNYYTLSKLDIGNHLRLFMVPLLEHLQDEKMVKGYFFFRMDLSMPDRKEKLVQTVEEGEHAKIYKHHWMDGEMTLNDGIKITWEIDDTVKKVQRNIQKIASRSDLTSKIYMDLTSKIKNIVFVDHVLKMRFFAPVDSFKPLEDGVSTSKDGNYYYFQIEQTDQSGNLDEGMDPRAFINALSAGYKKVKPLKK